MTGIPAELAKLRLVVLQMGYECRDIEQRIERGEYPTTAEFERLRAKLNVVMKHAPALDAAQERLMKNASSARPMKPKPAKRTNVVNRTKRKKKP